MKKGLIFTLLIFSSSAPGISLVLGVSLQRAVNRWIVGDSSKREAGPCLKEALERAQNGQWKFDSCLTDREMGLLLILAVHHAEESVAVSLIKNGADVNSRDEHGSPLLHLASWKGHANTVRALIENNADVDSQDKYGNTPLHLASWFGHTETARALMENSADVDSQDKYGNTPLHNASRKGHTNIVRALIENNADVNSRNGDYQRNATPLHFAIMDNQREIVRILIENGADPKMEDSAGRTAFDLAEAVSPETVDFLAEKTKTYLQNNKTYGERRD